jgi:serine/threonine-protein kinase
MVMRDLWASARSVSARPRSAGEQRPHTPGKPPAIGSRVAGKYRVLALLQSGGSGGACVAVDEQAGGPRRLVVLETLRAEPAPSSATIEAFVAEAHLRERMNHPNVVQTYGLVHHEGLPVMVTEYVEGESLATLLALAFGMPEFSLEVRLTILTQAVRGLGYIHQLGNFAGRPSRLVHSNVSPHDIVVGYDGSVKLSGFGSATGGAARWRSHAALAPANLEYLAPEQLHGSSQPSSDVFSAGIVLWELVALQRFWNNLPEYEVRRRLVAFDIPDVARLKPNFGGELARICRQALAPDPARRYPSAAELSIDLERFLVERRALAAPATVALVMKNACCALQREARQTLESALDTASAASRPSETPTEAGIWHVLTRERPRATSTTAAWAAGALAALLIAIVAQRARTPSTEPRDAKPVAIEPASIEPAAMDHQGALGGTVRQPAPLLDAERSGDSSALDAPRPRTSTTTIQTLMPERNPRPPASVASRAKQERPDPGIERRRQAEAEARARRARPAEPSTSIEPIDDGRTPRDQSSLSIRLER